MENHCQGLLVKSVCAFHYQTTAQPKAFTIQQFNRPLFSSLGHARPLLLTFSDCISPPKKANVNVVALPASKTHFAKSRNYTGNKTGILNATHHNQKEKILDTCFCILKIVHTL